MEPKSLFRLGRYSHEWIKDFYDQTGTWWGADPQEDALHIDRLEKVQRLCGPGPHRILDLGTGPGASAAVLADAGHHVTAVELSPARAAYARAMAGRPRAGSLAVFEADFYTLDLPGRFDVVTCWEVFGLGSDADQRRLLRRISSEWLNPAGRVLVDVYHPARFAREAGSETRLPPLPGVPGSVEMIERSHYDPLHNRWIDEWEPVENPGQALAQTVRCYTPADLALLIEGTGLVLTRVEVDGQALPFDSDQITLSGPLLDAWYFLAVLEPE